MRIFPFEKATLRQGKGEKALIMVKEPESLRTSGGTGLERIHTDCGSGIENNTHLKHKMPKNKKNH